MMWPSPNELSKSRINFSNFEIVGHELIFKKSAGTSRGIMKKRKVWFFNPDGPLNEYSSECAPLAGLSKEFDPNFEQFLLKLERSVRTAADSLDLKKIYKDYPSVYFALESLLIKKGKQWSQLLSANPFLNGHAIPINGLVWMESIAHMKGQVSALLDKGFNCLKFKIGALNWEEELELLTQIRKQFPQLEIRVDANGAFDLKSAQQKLIELSLLNIHSIEQPIGKFQWEEMAKLCAQEILPIALDEELIGLQDSELRVEMLELIRPQYLILKPGLLGGFYSCQEWIALAEKRNISWWITSALESNVGLRDIASFCSHFDIHKPHGIGTGSLFLNNIDSPLFLKGSSIAYDLNKEWNYNLTI